MTRLTSWIKAVAASYRRRMTAEQLAGTACALCGRRFLASEYRADYGRVGPLPHAYTCDTACTITAVDDVAELFRAAIPARQRVEFWHLGVDDAPSRTSYHGEDVPDEAYLAELAAQPRRQVRITHRRGAVTTRPLPERHARYIAAQARRLGFTATLSEEGAVR